MEKKVMCIEAIAERNEKMARLLEVWESAVRKTHTFLREEDLLSIKPEVPQGIIGIQHLYCFFDDCGTIQGFIGVEQQKIEMLFVDAGARGQGIGKQLLTLALTDLGARYVDVNEQNEQGAGFYKHMGFTTTSRSDRDEQGRPFPILHLKLNQS